ncbi:hypothetical protein MUCCIDRAFT_137874, partial [Mucor lusitanicus CBS 277.49]
ILRHLRWIMQKDKLGQDIFLLGPPGPLRRNLIMKYAEMTQREIEYVALSKDVTDADLKQRRELQNSTSFYVDQAAVRAAIHGRILVLDGIEKAERNVLPILNNLLENREMALDDGRFLTTKDIRDTADTKFEKVSPRFLVFALGLPVPPYVGYPLDPPLRSRFQSRDVKSPEFNNREIEVPEFPMTIESLAPLLSLVPNIHPRFLVDIVYPYALLPTCDLEQLSVIEAAFRRFGVKSAVVEAHMEARQTASGYSIANIDPIQTADNITVDGYHYTHKAIASFASDQYGAIGLPIQCGPSPFSPAEYFIETPYHRDIFSAMVLLHAGGKDICLVGTHKGVGKSALVRHFARNLGYTIDYIPLYRDMSSRDLLQRRSTTAKGDTVWENSLLVEAAIHGHLAVLDGIEALSYGTLNTLQRLCSDRETQLPDGTRLISSHRYAKLMRKQSPEALEAKRLIPIHPSFRIMALARAGTSGQTDTKAGSWLTAEILSMFHFIVVDSLPSHEEQEVLTALSPGVDEDKLRQLLTFARRLRRDKDDTIRMLSSALSTRQLIRICRRLAYFENESLYIAIHKAALSRFMPAVAREALSALMIANGIYPPKQDPIAPELVIEVLPSRESPEQIRIGNVTEPVFKGGDPMLIPNVVFHENPAHTEILREMLKDYQLGDHLLLIGNQGVGKNKLADYFLQLLQLPREYIQLHRDSTVQSLTTTPAIADGVLTYEDSALVKAVRDGTILVVDEADKAPTYVTAVLKSLVEDGQMVLGDGRRIISKESDIQDSQNYIMVHPNFRMLVLANRPGYPFLGNDFYREIGDVFSCHAVDNPDMTSEMFLLRKYGPQVSEDLLAKLSSAFTDLRKLTDEGLISYPYSTRELVNIVLHLQNYPEEGISKILQNVFDFDQYDQASKELVIEIFEKHGIPVGLESDFSMHLGDVLSLNKPLLSEHDAQCQNDGQGQGSGGSSGVGEGDGGSGSGGQGGGGVNGSGNNMNEEGRQEASFEDINNLKLLDILTWNDREMHDQAMEKMLKKLDMSQADFQQYNTFMENIRREVRELRVILESVEAKKHERVWLKNQSSGDLDDTKIIEGLTGERAIYKKRGEDDPELGLFQDKPKRMNFVFDLSASMFRFNTHDRRLERSMEVALMLMESFRGFEHKFAYKIVGHSGDGANIEFVVPGKYPKTEKEAFEVISKMKAHSQYCLSGDNTLGAASHSMKEVVQEESDDYFVVVLSDANIAQYNIHPNDIARILKSDDRVTAQMIFIGSIQDQAEQLKKALGSHAHICTENKELPKIIKSLFLSSMVKG